MLFGTATGASSAMVQLEADLKAHHQDIAGRIIGSAVVDEHHLTENQLLAKARSSLFRLEPVLNCPLGQ